MSKVFIVNKSNHNFSEAKKHGELVFLSEGNLNKFATNTMFRQFTEGMRDSDQHDYVVPCSLNVANCIACAIFARKHGKLNLLLFKDGKYIERNHVL